MGDARTSDFDEVGDLGDVIDADAALIELLSAPESPKEATEK